MRGAHSWTLNANSQLLSSTARLFLATAPSGTSPIMCPAHDSPDRDWDPSRLPCLIQRLSHTEQPAWLMSLQGSMEGVKLSQCDFVAVAHGVYAEHCLQMNVNNSHINATHCCIYACNVNQSSFSNLLLYKVRLSSVNLGALGWSCRGEFEMHSDVMDVLEAST